MRTMESAKTPAVPAPGFRESLVSDVTSGFIVFLLALPLSLGIAKASDFPPIMGLVTAMIGGLIVSFFSGSPLTIKGPAAGLIVIVAGSVADFGGGEAGWHLALGAMVVAGLVQILFGLCRLGKLVDFFPLSAIHGMLAAIGIIIVAKQIPVMLNVDPALAKGLRPLELIAHLPSFIINADPRGALLGLSCLALVMLWPSIRHPLVRKIPAALVVLAVAIPAALLMHFKSSEPPYALVHIGSLADSLSWNASFQGISQTGTFIKYVIMFALIGSIESLLTVKAVDLMDPLKRKSNANRDLVAIGIGNTLSAFIGGLPMISEVARSSANVANGAKTRWANFFHGFFMLLFVLVGVGFIELIPNCALAALLISVGIKLAHPREFLHMFKIGKEQLLIFVVTIFFTLYEDLLVGIMAGMLVKVMIHMLHGAPVSSLFKAPVIVSFEGDQYLMEISKAAIFTNFLSIKAKLSAIPEGLNVVIDLKNTQLVDHSVMENLQHFKHDYEASGGHVTIMGLDQHFSFSEHELSARVNKDFLSHH